MVIYVTWCSVIPNKENETELPFSNVCCFFLLCYMFLSLCDHCIIDIYICVRKSVWRCLETCSLFLTHSTKCCDFTWEERDTLYLERDFLESRIYNAFDAVDVYVNQFAYMLKNMPSVTCYKMAAYLFHAFSSDSCWYTVCSLVNSVFEWKLEKKEKKRWLKEYCFLVIDHWVGHGS